ncbi:hypothetical protein [Adhaeribacter soli]|uniref:Lipoprotein n=1 Tax=Adhaeribacter soli TaxID=2607655 RepID=A0A5N1IQQ8_9BACT|nr:hypothetical protein [Adhaeribacter soli]KAA9331865.1 hypothetical protein F0P94_13790 [Adhaeribacter soli]
MYRYLLPVAALLLTSCVSPYSISQLKPQAEETTWLWGREYVQQTAEGITVKVAYENNDKNYALFNVSIENNSEKTILADPALFSCKLKGRLLTAKQTQKQPARDPETVFLNLEKQRSRQYAEEANATIRQTTEVLTETASSIASRKQGETPEAREQRLYEREEANYRREQEEIKLEVDRLSLNQQKFYFEQELLRKTTLPSQSFIYGKVFFPRHENAETYELILPIGGQSFTFRFSQVLHRP